jgi:hypothetical protein
VSSVVLPGDEGRALDKVAAAAEQIVSKILSVGIDGLGPVKGAVEVAEEALSSARGDVEAAIDKLIRTHVRLAGTNGFVTGLGGFATMPISVPAGLSGFYVLAARLAGGIAHLRGHDLHGEEVRSAVLVAMLGAAGTEVLKDFGITVGTKSLAAALKKVPGRIFIEINKKVGFRLITKAGAKGVINMSKLVPFAGGPIGAGIDATSMRGIARYARSAFDVNE